MARSDSNNTDIDASEVNEILKGETIEKLIKVFQQHSNSKLEIKIAATQQLVRLLDCQGNSLVSTESPCYEFVLLIIIVYVL